MTDKSEKDALWKDLKLQWSYLKRDSGADEVKKGAAKERINEIQEALKLDKTDWNHHAVDHQEVTSQKQVQVQILQTKFSLRKS